MALHEVVPSSTWSPEKHPYCGIRSFSAWLGMAHISSQKSTQRRTAKNNKKAFWLFCPCRNPFRIFAGRGFKHAESCFRSAHNKIENRPIVFRAFVADSTKTDEHRHKRGSQNWGEEKEEANSELCRNGKQETSLKTVKGESWWKDHCNEISQDTSVLLCNCLKLLALHDCCLLFHLIGSTLQISFEVRC